MAGDTENRGSVGSAAHCSKKMINQEINRVGRARGVVQFYFPMHKNVMMLQSGAKRQRVNVDEKALRMGLLPPELRARIYFLATRHWRTAANRIIVALRYFWRRMGRLIEERIEGVDRLVVDIR